MGYIKFFLIAVVAILLITFCIVNRGAVSVSLFPFPYEINVPIFILAILCCAVGVVAASLLFKIKLFQVNSLLRKTKQRMEALENENKSLRSERDSTLISLPKK